MCGNVYVNLCTIYAYAYLDIGRWTDINLTFSQKIKFNQNVDCIKFSLESKLLKSECILNFFFLAYAVSNLNIYTDSATIKGIRYFHPPKKKMKPGFHSTYCERKKHIHGWIPAKKNNNCMLFLNSWIKRTRKNSINLNWMVYFSHVKCW